jgi:hypothetical protein
MRPDPFLRNLFAYANDFTAGPPTQSWVFTPTGDYANTDPNAPFITSQLPRTGYISGGVILKAGLTITRQEFSDLSYSEWKDIEAMVEIMPNVVCEEMLDRHMLWIYDKVPVITTMAA